MQLSCCCENRITGKKNPKQVVFFWATLKKFIKVIRADTCRDVSVCVGEGEEVEEKENQVQLLRIL